MKKILISITLSFTISLVSCFLPNFDPQISDEEFQSIASQARDMQVLLENQEEKNSIYYGRFEEQKLLWGKDNFDQLRLYYENARSLRALSNDIIWKIEEMKLSLVMKIEERSQEECENPNNWFRNKKKWASPFLAKSFLNQDDKPIKIKSMLEEYKARLMNDTYWKAPRDTYYVKLNLHTEEVNSKSWESHYFKNRPAFSVMYEFIRIQHMVRAAEGEMLTYQYNLVGQLSYKFDEIKPVIIPYRTQLSIGEDFEADIAIAAYNLLERPEGTINEKQLTNYEYVNGTTRYTEKAVKKGKNTVKGQIKITNPKTGQAQNMPFEVDYFVK